LVVITSLILAASLSTFGQQAGSPRPVAHLESAAKILNGIPSGSLDRDVRRTVEALKVQLAALTDAYESQPQPFVPASSSPTDAERDNKAEPMNWKAVFSNMERDLAGLLSDESALEDLPAETLRTLEEFRLELELFYGTATLGIEKETSVVPPEADSP
jgi:hypothetical protein